MTQRSQRRLQTRWRAALGWLLVIGASPLLASADEFGPKPLPAETVPEQIQEVGITEHVGSSVPADVTLLDEAGASVRLGSFLTGERPVLLQFVYHSCPTLCSMVTDGMVASLKQVPWTIGREFDVISVSIDPRDTPAIAATKKEQTVRSYGRDAAVVARGWHFLTGDSQQVQRLADVVGFSYRYNESQKQYAHPAGLFVLTPQGVLSRYLYGIEFPPLDARLALTEAAAGRTFVGTVDRLLLYCYRYDVHARSYVLYAVNLMRLAAGVTVLLLGGFLVVLWNREKIFSHRFFLRREGR